MQGLLKLSLTVLIPLIIPKFFHCVNTHCHKQNFIPINYLYKNKRINYFSENTTTIFSLINVNICKMI